MLRQGTVADSDKYAISDHLVLQVSVLAIGCQAVKAGDELFGCFSIALCSPVESRSLENNVLPNFEELVHLAQDLVVLLSVIVTDVGRSEDVFCFLTEAV